MDRAEAEAEKTMNDVNSNGEKLQLAVPSVAEKVVAPEDSVATTKEEEWVTKKKVELTTTRQIETRVKRQVVLEDGKIVEDTGPVVTTNTTEDTKKQEHSQTERRTLGDDDSKTDWNLTSNVFDRLKEIQEKTIKSREEREERTETEDVQHLGDMSDEGYMTAIKTGSDVRQALQVSSIGDLTETMPKIIHQSTKVKKCIDSEDKTELSSVQQGGKIVNETRTMRLHEELNDCDVSDDNSSSNADFIETTKKENFQRFYKTKKQDLTEYMENGKKIGEKLHFQEETSEGEKRGDEFNGKDEDTISLKLNRIRMRSQKNKPVLTNEWTNDENVPPAKKSSTFDEDEETRKEETSKWLEHHFGSESTKSSKASIPDLDDVIPSTQNSFINVTMKSQLNKPKQNSYFQNVPMFNANEKNREFPISPKTEFFLGIEPWTRKKSEDETSDPAVSDRMFFSSSPVPSHVQPHAKFIIRPPGKQLENGESRTRAYLVSNSDVPHPFPNDRRSQPVSSDDSNDRISNQNKKDGERLALSFDRREQLTPTNPNSSVATQEKEETPFVRCGPSSKKLYQRTRFAADIPPPPQPRQMPAKQKSKFGDGFRKLMDKLKSAGSERKNKKRSRSRDSRSPSPKENTYQNYNALDNYGSLMHRSDVDDYGRCSEEPVPPPRTKQNLSRSHRETRIPEKSVQRYYLGEDPFLGSIYGREKEYECRPIRTRERKRGGTESEEENDSKAKTLGRFSKSTSRLLNSERSSEAHLQSRGGVQTLPRKFREEKLNKINDSEEENKSKENDTWVYEHSKPRISVEKPMTHARSLINVSIVNRSNSPSRGNLRGVGSEVKVPWQGPAKPARTYRTNLSRSQSFNVQPHHKNSLNAYKSNFQLYGLEESPAPLESPSMIYRWSRNGSYLDEEESKSLNPRNMGTRTRDIRTVPTGITFDDPIGANLTSSASRPGKESRPDLCYSNSFRTTSTIKTNDSNPSVDGPQSLHFKTNRDAEDGVFTRTFRDGNVTKTVSRSESFGKDDYSETVRIESKSEDPLNPSETNTVKIFTKKKVPTKGGCGFETIESSETKTVVKSQTMRNGTLDNERVLYDSSPTGVVIKVRNISD